MSPVFYALDLMEARKICYRVVRTSTWSIPYSGELCNKNCIVKTSETLIVWSTFCCTAGSNKSDAIEGVPDQLLKGWQWCLGYIIDMLNCCWPDNISQRWLSIVRELCVIFECHAWINWYFQCTIISLTLCKECFKIRQHSEYRSYSW